MSKVKDYYYYQQNDDVCSSNCTTRVAFNVDNRDVENKLSSASSSLALKETCLDSVVEAAEVNLSSFIPFTTFNTTSSAPCSTCEDGHTIQADQWSSENNNELSLTTGEQVGTCCCSVRVSTTDTAAVHSKEAPVDRSLTAFLSRSTESEFISISTPNTTSNRSRKRLKTSPCVRAAEQAIDQFFGFNLAVNKNAVSLLKPSQPSRVFMGTRILARNCSGNGSTSSMVKCPKSRTEMMESCFNHAWSMTEPSGSQQSLQSSETTGYGSQYSADLINQMDNVSLSAEQNIDDLFCTMNSRSRQPSASDTAFYDYSGPNSMYSSDYVTSSSHDETLSEASIDEFYKRAAEYYELEIGEPPSSAAQLQHICDCLHTQRSGELTPEHFEFDIDDALYCSTLPLGRCSRPSVKHRVPSAVQLPSNLTVSRTQTLDVVQEEEHLYEEIPNDSHFINTSSLIPPPLPPKHSGPPRLKCEKKSKSIVKKILIPVVKR